MAGGVALPSVKLLPSGLVYHQFRTEYQKLLEDKVYTKETWYSWFSSYCIWQKRKL